MAPGRSTAGRGAISSGMMFKGIVLLSAGFLMFQLGSLTGDRMLAPPTLSKQNEEVRGNGQSRGSSKNQQQPPSSLQKRTPSSSSTLHVTQEVADSGETGVRRQKMETSAPTTTMVRASSQNKIIAVPGGNDDMLIEPLDEKLLGNFLPVVRKSTNTGDESTVAGDDGRFLPLSSEAVDRFVKSGSEARCVNRGMQTKCLINFLGVKANTFTVFKSSSGGKTLSRIPNPIYPADGQTGPLSQYHKYKGHRIETKVLSSSAGSERALAQACPGGVVPNPAIFLYRMSGHSTYHLWENNLGPFYATLNDDFGIGDSKERAAHLASFNDPNKLLVVFVDNKPRSGPKNPHLLDQLLRTFTHVPLLNASRIGLLPPAQSGGGGREEAEASVAAAAAQMVCFQRAIVGVAANSFPHRDLLNRMLKNTLGYTSGPPLLPEQPNMIFISRNHKTVTRGRKIANEEEVITALNQTLLAETGKPLRHIHMQDYHYKEQVELSAQTNIIFSPHGGGSAQCIWMRKGSVMVEFVAPVGKTLLNMYRSMCKKSGVDHIGFLADPDPEDEKIKLSNPRLFSNMVVPVDKILAAAKKALDSYRASYKSQQAKLQKSAAGK